MQHQQQIQESALLNVYFDILTIDDYSYSYLALLSISKWEALLFCEHCVWIMKSKDSWKFKMAVLIHLLWFSEHISH